MELFDVVIIGAGPGGLNCAKILGNAGKKVLLLEKNEEIGPKVCAGGLTRKSYKYLNIPEELINKKFDRLIFNAPRIKTEIIFPENYFYSIDRKKLGQWQLGKIDRNYVDVRKETRVARIEKNYIETDKCEKIGYKYLVGADGANSIVRRYLKLKTRLAGVAIQYLIPESNLDKFESYLDSRSFHCWYPWIIPHKDYVSVGYGYPGRFFSPVKMAKKFEAWLRKNKIDVSRAKYESFLINCDYKGFEFGNVFLVGDAAGLASPFTGEGIYQALVSGEDAAKIILDKKHKPEKTKEVIRERRLHYFMLGIVVLFGPLRNLLFDFVALCIRNRLLGRTLVRILT